MDVETPSTSGHEFLEYIKNRFGNKNIKVQFQPIGLRNLVNSSEVNDPPIFLYINVTDDEREAHMLKKVFIDEELCSTIVAHT